MFLKKDVHLGFAAEQELRQPRLMDSVALESNNKFRKEALKFVLMLLEKFFGRNPVKSAIARNVSVFKPKQMVFEKPDQLKEKLKKLLHHLIYLNQVTTSLAENGLSQYMSFLQNDVKLKAEMFKQYSPTVSRLDNFLFNNMEMQLPKELASVLKIALTLSHWQASVKRSFIVNNIILKDNTKCESINARKTIIDHMKSKGLKAHTVPVTKDLLHLVKLSRSRY